ncbi:hypothetical protein CR161_08065 [Prosthecochloris sp. ZM]|nr:hypothetical protein CR161_08065 [Prosthecochloris sp. ZM]
MIRQDPEKSKDPCEIRGLCFFSENYHSGQESHEKISEGMKMMKNPNDHDEQEIPNQTLVFSLIHRYVTGKIPS